MNGQPASAPATLQDLIDRSAVADTILAYAAGIDRRDWALYRSIFADLVEFDFSSWSGLKATMPADDWVAQVRDTLACFDATQHSLTNIIVRLDADIATTDVTVVARHSFGGELQLLGGFYVHRLVRQGALWKIVACRLVITWEQGDRALFARAHARGIPAIGRMAVREATET